MAEETPKPEWAFPGVMETLRLMAVLLTRLPRRERALPLLCLIRPIADQPVLAELRRRLKGAGRRQVPHVLVDANTKVGIHDLLTAVCGGLALDTFGGAPLRFPHYLLLHWVIGEPFGAVEVDRRDAELARRLRDRLARPSATAQSLRQAPEMVSGTLPRIALVLVRALVPVALFRLRTSGRVPGWGREYRWFMRQQYLAPRQSKDFVGFAVRLTEGIREEEDTEQLHKLLVHALLEDLRSAYQRRPWKLRGARRTSYPVVLLDNVAVNNPGYQLLRLVNAVRNETGRWDPLLVVAAAELVPPDQLTPSQSPRTHPAPQAFDALNSWEKRLSEARRRRERTAWYLSLALPAPPSLSEAHRLADLAGGLPAWAPSRPPWWARRLVPLVVLALAAGGVAVAVRERQADAARALATRCGAAASGTGRVTVEHRESPRDDVGQECIGYSDDARYVFAPDDARLADVQRRIFAANQNAERQHGQDLDDGNGVTRPYLTLAYLGQLDAGRAHVPQSEDLEGMAIEQRQVNTSTDPKSPLLRIVVANSGRYLGQVVEAAKLIGALAQRDATVVGVVGLDESRDETATAIQELTRQGLPMVVPALSSDDFERASPLYYQIAPPNRRQADVVAAYAADRLHVKKALVYVTEDAGDLYTWTLRRDVVAALERRGIPVRLVSLAQSPPDVEQACGYSGLVFFAGRGLDFVPRFLTPVQDTCGNRTPSLIMGDDSVSSRFVADRRLREEAGSTLPLSYVSKAGLVGCATPDVGRVQQQFLSRAKAMFDSCAPNSAHPLGEEAALAYDATFTFIRAVTALSPADDRPDPGNHLKWISPIPPTAGAISRELHTLEPFDGVTGVIDFAGSQIPTDKRLTILELPQISDTSAAPVSRFACGQASSANPARLAPAAGCP